MTETRVGDSQYDPSPSAPEPSATAAESSARVRNNGGPAFPQGESALTYTSTGMSLLDYFAGQALAQPHDMGVISQMAVNHGLRPTEMLARICYDWADAMLAERSK